MLIHCCGCGQKVLALLTNGRQVYPRSPALKDLPFWKCIICGNFVGCHHKTDNPTKPLGCIPTPELKKARIRIHAKLDPLWKTKKISRSKMYKKISNLLGRKYHTAELRSLEEVREIEQIINRLWNL